MKQYEVLPDGGVRLHLPSGMSVVSALKPNMLEKVGYTPYVPPRAEQPTAQLPPEALQAMRGTARGAGEEKRAVPDVTPIFKGDAYKTEGQRRNEEMAALENEPNIAERNRKADEISAKYSGSKFVNPEQQQKPGEGRIKVNVPDAAESAGGFVGGAPRRTVVVPGGFPRVSAQVQRGAPAGVLPGKAERDANAERVDQSDIGMAAADITGLATQHAAAAGAAQLQARAEDEIEKKRRAMFDDLSRRRELLSGEMMALETTQPDPKRFYRQMGSLGKVAAFAGALFGGIRAGLQGGENQFLARMDRLHEQEIQEQRDLRGLRERGIKVRMTELDKLTDLMQGDQDAAAKVLRLQYGIAGDHLLREAAKQTGDMKIRAGLEQTLAQRAQQRQFEFANIWQQFGDKTVENFQRVAPQVVDVGGGGAPRTKRQVEFADMLNGLEVRVRGKTGYLRAKADSTTQRFRQDQANQYEAFIGELGELRALALRAQESANPQLVSEVRTRLDALHNKLGAQENVLKGQGAMSDREYEAAARGLSNLASLFSKDTIGAEGVARIEETRKSWERDFKTFAENNLIEAPGDAARGVPAWQDEEGFYNNRRTFELPPWTDPGEPQVRD